MQYMEPDTTAPRHENGICHEVIHIHQHCRQQEEIISFPMFPVVDPRDKCGEDEVEKIVDESLKHFWKLGDQSYEL